LEEGFAFADENLGKVCKRREIARRTDGSLRGDNWMYATVEHLTKGVDDQGSDAAKSLGERVGTEQHHGARFEFAEGLADTDRVGAHEIHLKFTDVIAGDANVRELADAGSNGIGDTILRDQVVDDRACPLHCFAGIGSEQNWLLAINHLLKVVEGEVVSVQMKCGHEGISQLPVPGSQLGEPGALESLCKPFIVAEESAGRAFP
jgi:hypothetical protein